jgi:pyruvate kinase
MERRTKIIATIGPASLEKDVFQAIINAGADFVRVNTAYSTQEQHSIIKENLKNLSGENKVEIIFDILNQEGIKKIIPYNPLKVAVSFVESAQQLKDIKKELPQCQIISKIESEKGVTNFQEILDHSYGVMIARGDLGRAITLEKVPCVQKRFSQKTLEQKKFLIVATEMLLSMVKKTEPTRAETSDVANAVFEGASAVMLSEETAIGENPVQAVEYMRKIIQETEKCNYGDF